MGLVNDLQRLDRHERWLQWHRSVNKSGPEPTPGFKDCQNCPLRQTAETTEERATYCRPCTLEAAAEETLPPGPSLRFYVAQALAAYPTEAVAAWIDRLDRQTQRDLQTVRTWREDKKELRRLEAMGLAKLGS